MNDFSLFQPGKGKFSRPGMLYYSKFRPGRGDGDGLKADNIYMWVITW